MLGELGYILGTRIPWLTTDRYPNNPFTTDWYPNNLSQLIGTQIIPT